MKSHARVVVIGGGIVGCSILYHLVQKGWSDVVLVDRDELTSGSTWHAAGNCPIFAGGWNILKLQRYSTELYGRIGAEVDYPVNYHVTGSIRLAHDKDRMEEFAHVSSMARAQGIQFEMMSKADMRDRHPFLEVDDLEGGLWDSHDGDIDPSQITQALAKGARDGGAEINRFNPVHAIGRTRSGEWQVHTKEGIITCEVVVNAAGYRGAEVAALVGLSLPMVTMQHQYLVTEPIAELEGRDAKLPLVRDPDDSYYLREERGGLLLGPYEQQATPAWLDGIPPEFGMELYPDDLDRLEWYIERAIGRMPILGSVGVQRVINGPIPYSPDGLPLMGPAYPVPNFFHCCGFSFGIVQGGGAGKLMAEWIVEGEPEWDIWSCDSRRYSEYATPEYTRARAVELYQNEYAIGYPNEERPAGRPAKTTPVYGLLKGKGAQFGARGGWERATWFVPEGQEAKEELSFHHTNWFEAVAGECKAVRERVGVLDLGGFAKYEVMGPGAEAFLNRLVAGKLPKEGRVSLSYFLNDKAHIVSEVTITRLADEIFYLCSAGAAEWHDHHWMLKHMPLDGSVRIENITPQHGTLIVAGPRARDVLSKVTKAPLDNASFPWLSARRIEIGMATVMALRVNYVGELGWELHVPIEYQLPVYEAVMAAGAEFGIADFGMYALDSLRMEKCYRAWKIDLTHEYTPLDASLDRFVDYGKDFIGREALQRQQQAGAKERLVPLLIESSDVDAPYCATVLKDGQTVGLVGSAGYGHTLQKSIALAFVRSDLAVEGQDLEIEMFGEVYKAVVGSEPLYDPGNERIKA